MQQMHKDLHADLTTLGISFADAKRRFALSIDPPVCLCEIVSSLFDPSREDSFEDGSSILSDRSLVLTEQNMELWTQVCQIVKHRVSETFQALSLVQQKIAQATQTLYGRRAASRLAAFQKTQETMQSINILQSLSQHEDHLLHLQKRIAALQQKHNAFETAITSLGDLLGLVDQNKEAFISQLPSGLSKSHMDFLRVTLKQLLSQKRQRLVERLSEQHLQMTKHIQDLHFTSLEHQEWFSFSFSLASNPEFLAVLSEFVSSPSSLLFRSFSTSKRQKEKKN